MSLETQQIDIFSMMYPKFKINKPIRLIENFAGIGAQAKALKNLGIPFEHHRIVEWAYPSILAYNEIHHNELEDYGKNFVDEECTKDDLALKLFELGISANYNEPMKLDQIKRLKEDKLKQIYNAIRSTHNLVNIQNVKGKDLGITETDKYIYIYTYSFPCQDLSLAGKGAGMSRNSGTRSGMLWEVERILDECHQINSLPQVLLMENVPQVIGANAIKDFQEWRAKLESLGYSNYVEILNAKDYGIPQNRERCFMVSILGEYSYTFPKPIKLEKKLKDLLEKDVDEKYYLSDKMINYIVSKDDKYKVNENKLVINRNIACSKTTREGNTRADTSDYISDTVGAEYNLLNNEYAGMYQYAKSEAFMNGKDRFTPNKELSDCLQTSQKEGVVLIKNATQKGYLEAQVGDGIDISSRMEYHRGTVQKGITQTLTTSGGETNGVIVDE